MKKISLLSFLTAAGIGLFIVAGFLVSAPVTKRANAQAASVTSVSVAGSANDVDTSTQPPFNDDFTCTATVHGAGSFNPDVTWTTPDGGTIISETGTSITLTPATGTSNLACIAASEEDPSITGSAEAAVDQDYATCQSGAGGCSTVCNDDGGNGCAGDFDVTLTQPTPDTLQIKGTAGGQTFGYACGEEECDMSPQLRDLVTWNISPAPPEEAPLTGGFDIEQTQIGYDAIYPNGVPYEYSVSSTLSGLSTLPTGSYTLTLMTIDSIGHTIQAQYPISVSAAPPPPAPTVTVTASPSTITDGSSTTLTWSSTNASSCVASGGWSGAEAISGSTIESPSATTTYTLTCTGGGGNANASATVTVIGALPQPTGTIQVMSENLEYTAVGVAAKWDVTDGVGTGDDICAEGNECQGTSQTYTNQPAVGADTIADAGAINLPLSSISLLYPGNYVMNSIRLAPAALKNSGFVGTMLSLMRNMVVSTAEAFTLSPTTPSAQTLNPNATTQFIILWDPTAGISVSPGMASLTSTTGGTASTTVTVTNTGAPGSELTWTATPSAAWITVTPPADDTGLTNGASGNASEAVEIDVNAASLSVGTYTGTVTFAGVSSPGRSPGLEDTIPVTYTVTAAGGSGYNCTAGACVEVAFGADYGSVGSCDAACGFSGNVSGVSVSCSPSSVDVNGTSTCTAAVSGSGGYSSSVTWSVDNGTINQTGNYTAPGSSGTATVTATSKQDPTQSGSTLITITPPTLPTCSGSECPSCIPALSANPSSIVVPESSNLQYYCDHVTSCSLTGSDGTMYSPTVYPDPEYPGTPVPTVIASGTQAVSPGATTVYTLACTNANYSGTSASVTSTVQVTVGGSGQCEQNPNGVGCEQQ